MNKAFLPAIVFFVLTVILLCLPGSTLPSKPWLAAIHADKIVHILMFGTLCVLWSASLKKTKVPLAKKKRWIFLVLIGGIAYGTLMEFVQKYWIPNRSFELADIVADATGCFAGYVVSRWEMLWGRKKIGPDGNRDRNQN